MRAFHSILLFLVGATALSTSSLGENETHNDRQLLAAAPPSNPVADGIATAIASGDVNAAATAIAQAMKQGNSR